MSNRTKMSIFQKVHLMKPLSAFPLNQPHFPPSAVKCGFAHTASLYSFFHGDFLFFPCLNDFLEIGWCLNDWPSHMYAPGFCCRNPLRLPLAYIIPFVILTESTKERLEQLEEQKKNLKLSILQTQIQRPRYTKLQIVNWISRFKYGNVNDPNY